jgi:DNA-binding NtrC family response regulator
MPSVGVVVSDGNLHDLVRGALPVSSDNASVAAEVLLVELTGERNCKGAAAVRKLRETQPDCVVIAVSTQHSVRVTQQAVRLRIDDFFHLPNELDELREALAARAQGERAPVQRAHGPILLGRSPQMESLRRYVARVALTDSTVLITGETGTGKELVAETIHRYGPRRSGPFVSVNSAALPEALFESEMFGHERGAFTGAHARYAGKLRLAHRGTIFFDEIGDIGPNAQAKLLRALETREVLPLGATRSASIDVRVVAATNRDLESMTLAGSFRPDLFYRLNVVRIEVPPLRERVEDVPDLLAHFVNLFNKQFGRAAQFDAGAVRLLEAHDYPGNVRELKNIIESSFVNSLSDTITSEALPARLRQARPAAACAGGREELLHTLAATRWNISQTASQLRCSRMTIYRKMAEFKLTRAGN